MGTVGGQRRLIRPADPVLTIVSYPDSGSIHGARVTRQVVRLKKKGEGISQGQARGGLYL